jgi:hypothetical protein
LRSKLPAGQLRSKLPAGQLRSKQPSSPAAQQPSSPAAAAAAPMRLAPLSAFFAEGHQLYLPKGSSCIYLHLNAFVFVFAFKV